MRNCTRDEGGPFEFGNQVLISSHRKLLRSKAVVVSVAETPGRDSGRHGRERRAQANRAHLSTAGLGHKRSKRRSGLTVGRFTNLYSRAIKGKASATCPCARL